MKNHDRPFYRVLLLFVMLYGIWAMAKIHEQSEKYQYEKQIKILQGDEKHPAKNTISVDYRKD